MWEKEYPASKSRRDTNTKTKLDLTKLFYWGSFTTPICSVQR